jgi:hypothetical protein
LGDDSFGSHLPCSYAGYPSPVPKYLKSSFY